MKKKFTFLMAAVMLLMMMSLPGKVVGQAAVNTVLWSEDFSGYSANDKPSGSITNSHTGTTVYGGATLTYECANGGTTTQVYTNGGPNSNNNLLISKGNGTFTVSGIQTGGATELTVTYAKSGSGTMNLSTTTTGVTISGSSSGSTITTNGASTIAITFKNTSSGDNLRADDLTIKVKTAGASATTHKFYTAVSPANSGSVLAKDSGNNTISSGSDVAESANLTLTATANTGYKFSNWSVSGTGATLLSTTTNPTTFTMGTADATVTANFATAYTVTCATGLLNGSISADMETAVAGETVTISAIPEDGYQLSAVTVTNVDANDIIIDDNTAMFDMPANNVTVSATFTQKTTYTITKNVTPANSGTITADATAWEGKTVNVGVSPAAGYVFDAIAITKTTAPTSVSYSGNATTGFTFTMPAEAVTIAVTFRAADVYAKYTGDLVEGDYVIAYTYNTSTKALTNTVSSNVFGCTTITPNNDQIEDPAASIVWHIAKNGDYWTIYNENVGKYAGGTSTKNQGALLTDVTNYAKWSVTASDGTYDFANYGRASGASDKDNKWLRYNYNQGNDRWACYLSSMNAAPTLYKKVVNSTLAVATVANGNITATPASGSAIAEGASLSVSSGTTITLNATGEGSYVLDAWDVYKTGNASTKVTVTSNQFTMPDYNVTVSASFRLPTTFNVQYSVNGTVVNGLTQSGIAEGSSVTLPTTGFTVPTGFAYAGWTENEVSAELIGTATYTPTANKTLYLVFVKSGQTLGYNKVTTLDNITSGTYIIVNDNYCLPSLTATSSPVKTNDYKVTNASSTSNYTSVPANTEWLFTGTKTAMTIKNSAGSYLYSTSSNTGIRVSSTSDTWTFETNGDGDGFAMKEKNNNRYCATYTNDWRGYETKDHDNYSDGGILYLYKKTPVYTRVYDETTTSLTDIPSTSIVTVSNGVTFTLTGTNQGNETNLVIEDGGQLITSNAVQATVKKSITGHGSKADYDGWTFIASPIVADGGIDPEDVSGMTEGSFDLYRFNENADLEWENYKNTADHSDFKLVNGKGCLYANEAEASLNFEGTVNPSTPNIEVSLQFNEGKRLAGWNLVGNPFTADAYITDRDYYRMVYDKGRVVIDPETSSSGAIRPCEGVMVKATGAEQVVTFTTTAPVGSSNNGNIQIALAQNVTTRGENSSQTLDKAIISFNEDDQLSKFYFGTQDANLYIPMDNEEYAIVSSSAQGEMPVNFKAHRDGQYTITVNPQEVEMGYLHLIDNIGGKDIDLLATPSYTFNAKADDYESRFRLVFSANMVNTDMADDFAFFSNGQLVIANEGESLLQVIDVNGRIVMTESVNGTCSKAINVKAGVYVLRLIQGTDVKTQKIIVK